MIQIAGVLIENKGKYLLVQEGSGSAKGLWNLPAGHVDPGETLEQAARREAREESGLNVAIEDHLITGRTKEGHPYSVFRAKIIDGDISIPKNEISDAKWVSLKDAQTMNDILRNQVIMQAMAKAEYGKNST